jgi:hypothetical protein
VGVGVAVAAGVEVEEGESEAAGEDDSVGLGVVAGVVEGRADCVGEELGVLVVGVWRWGFL